MPNDSSRVDTGRIIVAVVLGALVLVATINAAIVIGVVGTEKLAASVVRLVLTATLAGLTYRGSVIGRGILTVLFMLGGGVSLASVFANGIINLGSVWMAVIGCTFLGVPLVLMCVPHCRDFLRYQQARRGGGPAPTDDMQRPEVDQTSLP